MGDIKSNAYILPTLARSLDATNGVKIENLDEVSEVKKEYKLKNQELNTIEAFKIVLSRILEKETMYVLYFIYTNFDNEIAKEKSKLADFLKAQKAESIGK